MKLCVFCTLVALIILRCCETNGKLSIIRNEDQRGRELEQRDQRERQKSSLLQQHQQQQQQQNLHEQALQQLQQQQRPSAYHPLNLLALYDKKYLLSNNLLESHQKRSQSELNDYNDWKEIMEDIQDNTILENEQNNVGVSSEYDIENISPLTYYLLLEKIKELQNNESVHRVRTPRLGRSIDFQQFLEDDGCDNIGNYDNFLNCEQQFLTQLIKKSVPFKPRLGKRDPRCH